MSIFGDMLDTELSKAQDISSKVKQNKAIGETEDPKLLKTNINSAVMSGNVKVKSIGRVARGDRAVMLRNNGSVTLTAANKAELRDFQGILLHSPRFVLYHRDNVVKADGPGTIYIAASAAARAGENLSGRRGRRRRVTRRNEPVKEYEGLPGTHPLDYILSFEGDMVYNLMKRRIVFQRNVELVQQTLYGRCDQMEALLAVDETKKAVNPENQGLTLVSAECIGNVFFRRFEPPQEGENLREVLDMGPTTNRPGTTVLVECAHSLYDIGRNKIHFTDTERGVKILEQVVKSRGRVSRTLYHNMDKAILNRNTGDVTFPIGKRRPAVKHLPVEGPLRFEN
jgi:lipopolysaccharide export system protein LptA